MRIIPHARHEKRHMLGACNGRKTRGSEAWSYARWSKFGDFTTRSSDDELGDGATISAAREPWEKPTESELFVH